MKYKVLISFAGSIGKKKITAVAGEVIDIPARGHDFVKAGFVEKVPMIRKPRKKAKK